MDKLQAIKAFAELEGYETMISTCSGKGQSITAIKGKRTIFNCDPTDDKVMTFDEMVKYKVTAHYQHKRVTTTGSSGIDHNVFCAYFEKVCDLPMAILPMAIIESILKSRGLWKRD